MRFVQVTLWLTFLLLGGKQLQSWSTAPESTTKPSLRSNLGQIISPASSPWARNLQLRPLEALARFQPAITPPNKRSWPTQNRLSLPLELSVRKIENDSDKSETETWSYASQHFEFVSDAPLGDQAVREFTALFELTHLYCSRLPFQLARLQTGEQKPMKVRLIEDYSHYLREGGTRGSGGIYLTNPDLILVPFEGLGLEKKSANYALDRNRSNQTLMHEATHMMMRGPLLKDGWFVEGSAEYVATIPIQENTLLLANHRESIVSYVTSYGFDNGGGHNLGSELNLAPLQTFMECDYRKFQKIKNSYPYSLLVFHYFAHSDGEGDAARLKAYAQALNAGADNSTALKKLLAGRDYKTLERLLTNTWRENGITLTFGSTLPSRDLKVEADLVLSHSQAVDSLAF